MDTEMQQAVLLKLEALAAKLGVAVEQLWEILVQGQRVSSHKMLKECRAEIEELRRKNRKLSELLEGFVDAASILMEMEPGEVRALLGADE